GIFGNKPISLRCRDALGDNRGKNIKLTPQAALFQIETILAKDINANGKDEIYKNAFQIIQKDFHLKNVEDNLPESKYEEIFKEIDAVIDPKDKNTNAVKPKINDTLKKMGEALKDIPYDKPERKVFAIASYSKKLFDHTDEIKWGT